MFWLQCKEKQNYNSEQLPNRTVTFAPIGYDVKKSRMANVDYRIQVWGDGEWLQEWKNEVQNENIIYSDISVLKTSPL